MMMVQHFYGCMSTSFALGVVQPGRFKLIVRIVSLILGLLALRTSATSTMRSRAVHLWSRRCGRQMTPTFSTIWIHY
jgi:hypothetical protein